MNGGRWEQVVKKSYYMSRREMTTCYFYSVVPQVRLNVWDDNELLFTAAGYKAAVCSSSKIHDSQSHSFHWSPCDT